MNNGYPNKKTIEGRIDIMETLELNERNVNEYDIPKLLKDYIGHVKDVPNLSDEALEIIEHQYQHYTALYKMDEHEFTIIALECLGRASTIEKFSYHLKYVLKENKDVIVLEKLGKTTFDKIMIEMINNYINAEEKRQDFYRGVIQGYAIAMNYDKVTMSVLKELLIDYDKATNKNEKDGSENKVKAKRYRRKKARI